MTNEKIISSQALIDKFVYALQNEWGYIWGTAGELWTAAKQKELEKTTDENRAMSRKYGSKWIGHYVADCSGMFVWAFRQFGIAMSHISSNIYISYCTANKGRLTDELKQKIRPGTAVFTGDAPGKHPHVGLYIGNGDVIEAAGTKQGVIKSRITDRKWTFYGELKNVDYTGGGDVPVPEPTPEPVPEKVYAIVTGKNLALREGPSTNCRVLTRAPTGSTVKIEEPPKDWEYVDYKGRKGYMMKQYLKEG